MLYLLRLFWGVKDQRIYRSITDKKISDSVLAAFLAFICFCILWKATWGFDFWSPIDEYQLFRTTAVGKPSCSWTGNGRFLPLGLCDYCILLFLPFGNTVTAHYLYNSVMMIFSSIMLYKFLNKVGKKRYISVFSLLILFSTSAFMRIHVSCVFPERMLFFMLSAFMLFAQRGREKQSSRHYFLAVLAAAYATYLKEPFFGVFIIIATVNIIFGQLSFKDKIFNGALLVNSAIFVTIYVYRLFFRDSGTPYASITFNPLELSFKQFGAEPILILMAIIACVRAYSILVKNDREQIFIDSLLFAGVGYTVANMMFKFKSTYYFFPSVLLFIPAFTIFILEKKGYSCGFDKPCVFLSKKRSIFAVCFALVCTIITIIVSGKVVLRCWEHRGNDHLFFEYISRKVNWEKPST
ncbi:MAG: hypothetical protein LBG04_01755 [Holosporaceae bacterium]|jgi:hypothetical protein|nr:hypothetical protein [Holosporaceae bacterium]